MPGIIKKTMPEIQRLVNQFIDKLKGGDEGEICGSNEVARMTAELLRLVISQQRILHEDHLIEAVRNVGEKLIAAYPTELVIGNMVRRVLHIIRTEDVANDDEGSIGEPFISAAQIACHGNQRSPSLHALLDDIPEYAATCYTKSGSRSPGKPADESVRSRQLKHTVIAAINDLLEDINISREQIAEQAVEHIHENEVILTFGSSRTVMEFLKAAKDKKRTFRVFVAEGAPRCGGYAMAKKLSARGLKATVITEAAVYAMISHVNMVIVGAHALMTNGGIITSVGMNMVALAARKHAVPFVVVAGTHKLCPLYPHNPEILLNDLRSLDELLNFGEFSDCMDFGTAGGDPLLHVVNPAFDYVPPELVTLFISDIGGLTPSYIYRLVADYYSADDLVVQQQPALQNPTLE